MLSHIDRKSGTVTRGEVRLGDYPDGMPVSSPVMIASGRGDGPALWVQALIHGPEIVGPTAILKFLKTLDLSQLRGTIIFLMSANPLGFRGYNRLTPQDGFNLNRVFPGDPEGPLSYQLADRLLELSVENSDAMLDLHSGGDLTITCHYTLFHNNGTAEGQESERLGWACGAPYIWNSLEDGLKGCHFTNYTKIGRKPSLIVESGGGARVWEHDVERLEMAIKRVAQAMDMLPGKAPLEGDYRLGGDAMHLKCRHGGLFMPRIKEGDDVVEGQHLADIVNFYGDVVEEVRCPVKTAWIGSIRRPNMPIYNGDQVFEIVETKGRGTR
ncbi:succinylglutamate desuccinylase/aspartoacylase family protein [Tianweitania sp. BSSL-BM11]|uniref:Succinylglutamate desuccinylase/aspartoacylase family protein n=1 Tax=Tianweitania aestuarii TaxID=2814886 RepID=A0ABS5RWJ3_9HYPH|nr:succinylglutamate desuccinylase/aspartoacylase family protein [Tianweitania aestuarii]MBS9721391.1 succinylglutamate desuccinylase/aspartoacylase family protein [Tianweitania aestuarii]